MDLSSLRHIVRCAHIAQLNVDKCASGSVYLFGRPSRGEVRGIRIKHAQDSVLLSALSQQEVLGNFFSHPVIGKIVCCISIEVQSSV